MDIFSGTTMDKTDGGTVPLKSTGHDKCQIYARLTAKADGTKLKTLIVFKNANATQRPATISCTKKILQNFSFGRS